MFFVFLRPFYNFSILFEAVLRIIDLFEAVLRMFEFL